MTLLEQVSVGFQSLQEHIDPGRYPIAAVWAAVSIPSASPLTITMPRPARRPASFDALRSPSGLAFRDPTIATLPQDAGIAGDVEGLWNVLLLHLV